MRIRIVLNSTRIEVIAMDTPVVARNVIIPIKGARRY